MDSALTVFIHIHKCAGSSLAPVMRRNLFRPQPELAASLELDTLTPPNLVASILRTARRDGYVMGHLGYGAHRIFASPCRYFTMLREPRERLISLWRHAASTPNAYYHQAAKDLSFASFLAQRNPLELDNGMVRFLSGDPAGLNVFINPKPFGTLDQSDLDRALHNLAHRFEGFGLVSQFDASLLLMKHSMGYRNCFYVRRNESSSAVAKPEFPDLALPLVEFDQALVAEAERIFQQRVSSDTKVRASRLKRFRSLNHAMQPITKINQVLQQSISYLKP